MFDVELHREGKRHKLGPFHLYVEGVAATHALLDKDNIGRIDTYLESIERLYIGLGYAIEFYQRLAGALDVRDCVDTLVFLHDAAILRRFSPNNPSLSLTKSEAFKDSHLRSGGAVLAYENAAALFEDAHVEAGERSYSFELVYKMEPSRDPVSINFEFGKSPLPSSINLLIGNNGTGKTLTLHALVKAISSFPEYLHPPPSAAVASASAEPKPPISQVVVVAFTPFEAFPREYRTEGHRSRRHSRERTYAYCGFRDSDDNIIEPESIWKSSYRRWRSIVDQDEDLRTSKGRTNKAEALIAALRQAFDFDEITLSLGGGKRRTLYSDARGIRELPELKSGDHALNFRLQRKPLYLSAGQRAFVAVTIAVVDYIREGALLLLEEPELHLHPTLEVRFMRLLLELLRRFHASAVLATHSIVLAREIPAANVHIFRQDGKSIVATRPAFETFGADLTRLGNYIFDDLFSDPSHEIWLREQLRRLGSVAAVREELGSALNLESSLYLRSLEESAKRK
jgi:energy-coupling factor transporter ATP-binding protein EcfA2